MVNLLAPTLMASFFLNLPQSWVERFSDHLEFDDQINFAVTDFDSHQEKEDDVVMAPCLSHCTMYNRQSPPAIEAVWTMSPEEFSRVARCTDKGDSLTMAKKDYLSHVLRTFFAKRSYWYVCGLLHNIHHLVVFMPLTDLLYNDLVTNAPVYPAKFY